MELPDPTTPKPEETSSYSRWSPTISNDSDWNKMNSRRNPDRAIVLKGQKSQKVLHTARKLMKMSEEDIHSSITTFGGNNWGFSDTTAAINFIVELHEADTQYLICMSNDGVPSGSWSHSKSPYRAYNRAPTSDETEWHYAVWQSRTPVEKMWQNRACHAIELQDIDWYNIQKAAEAKSAALRIESDNSTMNRANELLAEATVKVETRILVLGAVDHSHEAAKLLVDGLFNIWKQTEHAADEAHKTAYDIAWAQYQSLMSALGYDA